jgi:hypothetical protein
MTSISEAADIQSQMMGALRDGVESLDLSAEVTFQGYSRTVLPLDGFVFWVPTVPLKARGSLHYSQETQQNEDETQGFATVLFTSEDPVADFSATPDDTLWVASVAGFRYAFSQQQGFYSPAGLWHYFGHSVQPALATQLLDRPQSVDPNRAVVSNSLPLWLMLNGYLSPFYDGFNISGVPFVVAPPTLYPSFMLPSNLVPPYGAVHIGDGETDTEALQAAPLITADRSHYQLVADTVRVTLYGLQNDECMDFIDTVNQYSRSTNHFGIMNSPVFRDSKRTQNELNTIAMKKVATFRVSYYQTRVAQVARQLILTCVPTYLIKP